MAETVKVTRTIDYVNPIAREWTRDGKPPAYFLEAIFDDASQGSVAVWSKDKVDENLEALKALINTPTEFELEDDGEYKGVKKWRIKDFAGKPAGSSGGGGSRGSGGGMSHAQVGLLAAATLLAPQFVADPASGGVPQSVQAAMVIELGETFTEHLFSRRKGDEPAEETKPAPAPSVPAADAITLPQMKRLKELGASRGLSTPETLAAALEVSKLGDLSADDAQLTIEAWSE